MVDGQNISIVNKMQWEIGKKLLDFWTYTVRKNSHYYLEMVEALSSWSFDFMGMFDLDVLRGPKNLFPFPTHETET